MLFRSGNIKYDIDKHDYSGYELKKQISSFLGFNGLIDFLSPAEYFHFIACLYDHNPDHLLENLSDYSSFLDNISIDDKKYISKYSTGNKQKIGIVSALFTNSRLVILDEPFNYLDPTSQIELNRIIKTMNNQQKTTFIISSHNIDHIASIASRILLLDNGQIIHDFKNDKEYTISELYAYFRIANENKADRHLPTD